MDLYTKLFESFGPQHWWPGDTPFEVMVGAILTQNTNWGNVEKAINNLKGAGALSQGKLHQMELEELAGLIRPAGYFNVKAKRLKSFIEYFVGTYSGKVGAMKKRSLAPLRRELLNVNGIGEETADSILLYALEKPVFVIDAYTKRMISRHGYLEFDAGYLAFQELFHSKLPADVHLYNEYHALIVRAGKEFCSPKPKCPECPLNGFSKVVIS